MRYKVKRIEIKPGAQISLQRHLLCSEHWTVIDGIAEVQVGAKTVLIKDNESLFIPVDALHRLTNPGDVDLIIIETQVGDYIGEDDIIRYSDNYGRESS